MMAIIKSVIKSVKQERIRNKWGSTPYGVSEVRHTTRVFLISSLRTRASTITRLFHPGLIFFM